MWEWDERGFSAILGSVEFITDFLINLFSCEADFSYKNFKIEKPGEKPIKIFITLSKLPAISFLGS